ncbi:hypothetical protein [Lactiplantibacillus garii]|nr:hypothetical protein [Lactiplantibacillus garii]
MKNWIFGVELVALAAWIKWGASTWSRGIVGVVVISGLSQLLHVIFKAR